MMNSMNIKSQMGQVHQAKATSRVPGGYIIEARALPHGKGFMPDPNEVTLGKDILVKVVGQHQGMALLHPVFSGFR